MIGHSSLITHHSSLSFYVTGGTLERDAPCYVLRQADKDLYAGLNEGQFCYVLTSRQMGKSSLMVRTAVRLRAEGVSVAVLDLTAIGQNVTAEQWYDGLLGPIGQQLHLEDELDDFWLDHERLGPLQRWMQAIREVVLPRCPGRIVIFVDEIDAVRSLPFSTDEFFAGIRELYNHRTQDPELNRLTFCLLGVATPSDLIRDTRTTPFNIGRRIELSDFTEDEAAPLTQGLGREEKIGAALLKRILHWTGGHPYLTQRLCQAVAEDASINGADGVDRQCEDLFLSPRARERDDNLLFVRERMLRSEADLAGLLSLYAQVRRRQRVRDDETNPLVSVLRLSGITRAEGGNLSVRNRVYERVFDQEWVKANMPDAELRRQRAAYRRGVWRATLIAAVFLVAISSLTFLTIRQYRAATKQQLRAEQRFNDVRKLANSFLFDFHDAIEKLPGSTPARELLVKRGLEYLNSLAQESKDDPSLQIELARAYERVSNIQWHQYYANLGDTAGALASYRQALEIRESLLATHPSDAQIRRDTSAAYIGIGDLLAATGDTKGSLENYRKALAVREALSAADPANLQDRLDLANSYQKVGDRLGNPNLANLNDTAGALENYRQNMAILKALSATDPKNPKILHPLAVSHFKVGIIYEVTGEATKALELYRPGLALYEAVAAADPTNAKFRRDLSVGQESVGRVLKKTGDKAGALENFHQALAIRDELAKADPKNVGAQSDLAFIYRAIGDLMKETGDNAKALENYRQTLALTEAISAADPKNEYYRLNVRLALDRLIGVLVKTGQMAEARGYTTRLLALQKARADQPKATADDLNEYASMLLKAEPATLRDPALALSYAKRAVEMTKGNDPSLLETLALAYYQTGDRKLAIETEEKVLALLKPGDPDRREAEANLAKFKAESKGK